MGVSGVWDDCFSSADSSYKENVADRIILFFRASALGEGSLSLLALIFFCWYHTTRDTQC